jgi:hypothetical protein
VRKKIASNSASDNAATPRWMSFSRGRSALGHWEIAMGNPLPVVSSR